MNLKLKTCIEGSMKSIGTYKHAVNKLNMINTNMDKTSCTSSNYGFTEQIGQVDNPNKKTLIYIPHTLCRHRLSLYNLSCLKSNKTIVCLELSSYVIK